MAKKLYVGNLSYDTSDSMLQELFEEYGTVEDPEQFGWLHGKAGFLPRFAECHGLHVSLAVGVAADLKPLVQFLVMGQ